MLLRDGGEYDPPLGRAAVALNFLEWSGRIGAQPTLGPERRSDRRANEIEGCVLRRTARYGPSLHLSAWLTDIAASLPERRCSGISIPIGI